LHAIAQELVEKGLVEAGFELLHREDSLSGDSPSRLVSARRPPP